jgi:hypothetical protein
MTSYLMKNGEVHCGLVETAGHSLPTVKKQCWHECFIITVIRVEGRPADQFSIVIGGYRGLPFLFERCRVVADGWMVEGQVLF